MYIQDYVQGVWKIHPNAYSDTAQTQYQVNYVILQNGWYPIVIGKGDTEKEAWENAYNNVVMQLLSQ